MCHMREITGRLDTCCNFVGAEADGFRFSGFGINGIIYKHLESGKELDQFELMRLYPAKESDNA